jgi:hypothetical protein
MTQSAGPDPFEFLKKLWGPMGLPMPGMVTPTLDVAEIDKRIAELKSVETWLTMNLNLLKMSIQGLEMQRATLSAMQGMQAAGAGAAKAGAEATQQAADAANAGAAGNPFAEAWWNMLQQAQVPQPPEQPQKKK